MVRTVVADFAADKEVVERLGREYGFSTLFVWQLSVADKPILSAQERSYAGWLPSSSETKPGFQWWVMPLDLREIYDAIGQRVISHYGVVDVSNAFDDMPATAFIDWMHTSESGNERVARAIYQRLAPEFPERKWAVPKVP